LNYSAYIYVRYKISCYLKVMIHDVT